MGRNNRRCWSVVVLVGMGLATAVSGEKDAVAPTAKQIAQWIQDLDDDQFAVREAASKNLLKAGKAVIEAVATAAAKNSPEVAVRSFQILEDLTSSPDEATARSAKEVLVKLAASTNPAVADRAKGALRAHQQRVAAVLEACGAQVQTSEGQIVAVNFDAAKELGKNLRLLHELPDLTSLSFSTPLMDDAGMAALKNLPRVATLNLFESRVGDEGLKYLKTLPSLRRVPMGKTLVTDKGLVHLKDLTQLEYVGLRGNQVTDAGLVHLKNLTKLTGLHLGETKITDAGLVELQPLIKLTSLTLTATAVTPAGVARLKQVLPQLQISYP